MYFLKRLGNSLLILLLTVSFVFIAGRMIGDPALNMLGPGASDVALENLRRAAGLNDPILVQYGRYIGNLLQGDFGVSYRYGYSVLPTASLEDIGQPVIEIVLERLPATFFLAAAALAFAVPLGLFMGVTAAAYPRSIADRIVTVLSLAGVSVVQFWLGLMLIVLFAVHLGWLPTGGYEGPSYVILPALTLAARPIGRIAQVTRSAVLEETVQTLHRHRPRQGRGRGTCDLPSRPEERRDPHRHHDRRRTFGPSDRRDPCRKSLCLAGHWPVDHRLAVEQRPAADPGLHRRGRGPCRHGQLVG